MRDYTVVVLGWNRPESLVKAVGYAATQRPCPREIVVWQNAPCEVEIPGVNLVRSVVRNYGPAARHVAGLLADCDVVVFVDDDVWLKYGGVCAALVEEVERHPGSVVGGQGVCLNLAGGRLYDPAYTVAYRAAEVDVVKGMFHAVRREHLPAVWDHELPPDVRAEDDIVLSASVTMRTGERPRVVALARRMVDYRRDDRLGLQHRPDHYARRDAACRYMMQLGWLMDRSAQARSV